MSTLFHGPPKSCTAQDVNEWLLTTLQNPRCSRYLSMGAATGAVARVWKAKTSREEGGGNTPPFQGMWEDLGCRCHLHSYLSDLV